MWCRILFISLLIIQSSLLRATSTYDQIWENKTDSLKFQLLILLEDTSRVKTYNRIAFTFVGNNNFEAISYADSALLLAQSLNYRDGEAIAFNRLGLAHAIQGNYTKALNYILQAQAIHEADDDFEWLANDLNVLGIIYKENGELLQSIVVYERLLKIIPEGKMRKTKGMALSNKGMAYFSLHKPDSAYANYQKALKIFTESGNIRESAFVLDNIADVLTFRKEYNSALDHLIKAIEINEDYDNKVELGNNYIKLAKIHFLAKDYNKSLFFLDHAAVVADNNNFKRLKKEVYTDYKLTYLEMQDLENAYLYSEKERIYSDSLFKVAQTEELENVRKAYEFDKVNQSLLLSRVRLHSQQRKLYALIGGAFILLAFIYILLKFFRNKVRSNEALAQLNSEMSAQSIKLQQAYDQIQKMNDNLERLIEHRTEVLQVQNAKLIEYAHFNAHEIRGPMARLTGLLNLSKKYPDEIENQDFINRVFVAITELSDKVNEISSIFSEDSSLDNSKNK